MSLTPTAQEEPASESTNIIMVQVAELVEHSSDPDALDHGLTLLLRDQPHEVMIDAVRLLARKAQQSSAPPPRVRILDRGRQFSRGSSTFLTFRRVSTEEELESTWDHDKNTFHTSASVSREEDDVGFESINGYMLLEVMGRGASGVVHRALKDGKAYALKEFYRSKVRCMEVGTPTHRQAVLPEPYALRQLHHKHIVRVYECFDDPAQEAVFLVMELVEGGAVAHVRPDGTCSKTLSAQELLKLVLEMASALHHIHSHGLCHGDLKPENMLCSGTFYVLADFGVAAAVVKQPPPAAIETTQRAVVGDDEDEDEDEEELRADAFARQRREAGAVGGTQAFDSPELFEGQHRDGASDMWAFGVTIYVLYFGVVPFTVVRGLSSLRDAVMRGELTFPPPREGDDEEDYAAICTIIRALLIKPSSSRWTAHEAFKYVHRYLRNQDHTWVRSVPSSSLTVNEPHVIPPACVPVVPAQRGRVRHSAAAVMPFARRRIVEAQRHTGAQYSQDDASDVDARTQDILSM